jgi:hypothetical protein
MKRNVLVSFVAGLIVATVAVSGVTWLQASSDNVITACANKKTGVMRYLIKGKCNKKTETRVIWNQAGIPGPPGIQGDAGARGDTGAPGKHVRVVDAAGRDHGMALSVSEDGYSVTILFEDGVWTLQNRTDGRKVRGFLSSEGTYSDSACTSPLWYGAAPAAPHYRGSRVSTDGSVGFVKAVGEPFLGSTVEVYYSERGSQTCTKSTFFNTELFIAVETTTGPTFTPPFRLVVE